MASFDLFDLLGAGVNIFSGIQSAKASKKAGKYEQQAAEQAAANFRPYAQLGDQAAGELSGRLNSNALLGDFSADDFEADPGYQFRLSEGNKAIDRAAGARGGRYSGATLKDLQRFSQGLASDEYDRAYNRDNTNKTRQYNILAGGVNAGQGAQGTVGNFLSNAGTARASGTVGANNAIWQGVGGAFDVLADSRYADRYGAAPYRYQTR